MHNYIKCGRCGTIVWHGDSMPSVILDGCKDCPTPVDRARDYLRAVRWEDQPNSVCLAIVGVLKHSHEKEKEDKNGND